MFLSEPVSDAHCEVWNAGIEVDHSMRILEFDRKKLDDEDTRIKTKSAHVDYMNVAYVNGAKMISNLIYRGHRTRDQILKENTENCASQQNVAASTSI